MFNTFYTWNIKHMAVRVEDKSAYMWFLRSLYDLLIQMKNWSIWLPEVNGGCGGGGVRLDSMWGDCAGFK